MPANIKPLIANITAFSRGTVDSLARSFVSFIAVLVVSICFCEVISSWALMGTEHLLGFPGPDEDPWYTLFVFGWPLALLFHPGYIGMCMRSKYRMGCSVGDFLSESTHIPRYIFASIIYFVVCIISFCLFVIPGIFLSALLSLYGFAIVEERLDSWDALKRSCILTRPFLGIIIPVQAAVWFLCYIVHDKHFYFMQLFMLVWFAFAAEIYAAAKDKFPPGNAPAASWWDWKKMYNAPED